MEIKVYFKTTNHGLMLFLWFFCIALLGVMTYFVLTKNEEILPMVFIVLIDVLIIFGFVCSEIYGFKIKNGKLRIISQRRVKFCKLEDVNNIYVEFIKIDKYYECYASLEMNDGKTRRFVWDKIRSNKGPGVRFNITDKNVDEFKNKLSECEKISVDIK